MTFRAEHALNACDTFMLAMDGAMRRDGCAGNICHVLLSFPRSTDLCAITASLKSSSLLRDVSSLRLKTPLLRTPRWVASRSSSATITELALKSQAELEEWIVHHETDPRRSPPCGFVSLPQFGSGPALLFYWHHSLCDARGGESLLKQIGSGQPAPVPLFPGAQPRIPLRKRLEHARAAKSDIFRKTAGGVSRLKRAQTSPPKPRFHKVRLTPAETKTVEALSLKLTNGIFPSALHLAASARAAARTLAQVGLPAVSLFVPVPHDMRRYARERHLLLNQVSFIFFRLDEICETPLGTVTNSVIEQLHASVAAERPQNMLAFFGLIAWLPPQILWRIIEMPSRGHPASMYFSDVGPSLSSLSPFCAAPVSAATHYPPVLCPPGLTTVWSRFGESLEVTVCYDEAALGARGLDAFVRNLREELGVSESWDTQQSAST